MDPKHAKIVEAAAALFVRHGFRKVTMSDIAEAAGMSRPTLYAAYENKVAVLTALLAKHTAEHREAGRARVATAGGLQERLEVLFDEWILAPFASVIDVENALDLLTNIGVYAPEGVDGLYAVFESELSGLLAPEMSPRCPMTAEDLARILTLASRGLKASTATLPELRRMAAGLITMAIATARTG